MIRIIILFTLLVGCVDSNYVESEWQIAPKKYKCTPYQWERVAVETEWCNKNTDYIRSYCYGTAMIRNCTKPQEARP